MKELRVDIKESIEEYLGYVIAEDDVDGIMNSIYTDIQDRVDDYIDKADGK